MYTHSESRANCDTFSTHFSLLWVPAGYRRVSCRWALIQRGWCKVRFFKELWEPKKKEKEEGAEVGREGGCMLGVSGVVGDLIPHPQIRWLNNVLLTSEWTGLLKNTHFIQYVGFRGKNHIVPTKRSQTYHSYRLTWKVVCILDVWSHPVISTCAPFLYLQTCQFAFLSPVRLAKSLFE